MSVFLCLLATVAAVSADAESTNAASGYEKAGQCLKSVIRANLYEKLLISMGKVPADSSNEKVYEAWQSTFSSIVRWEGKRLGKSDAEMMADIRAMSDDLKEQAVGSSSNVLISSYKQAIDEANNCRNLY
jgi:hypothetical protein